MNSNNEYNARPLVYTPSRRVRAERRAAEQRRGALAGINRVHRASVVK